MLQRLSILCLGKINGSTELTIDIELIEISILR